ncbi:MAG TPA: trypsin-like peptidase domain-containing protein [Gemmataceae bacterium]|nr:trypsin-like peptidase domain-containing protein [Gemmataceae bacterium]
MSRRLVLVAVLVWPSVAFAQATPAEGGVKVYQSVLKSTVWIVSQRPEGTVSGSGSLIDRRRQLVLTNYHVVGDVDRVRVLFPAFKDREVIPERDFYRRHVGDLGIPGVVKARDKQADLALIQIERVPTGAQALPIAAEGVSPGQSVHSVGNPGASGALWVYTPGRVRQVYQKKWAAKAGRDVLHFEARVIESDSPTNPGDSGGPLVNDRAELVGVTEGGATNASLLNVFVDVSEVKRFLASQMVRDIQPPPGAVAREPLTIRDEAKFFSPEAVQKANQDIATIAHRYGRDLLIETHPTVPADDLDRVKAMSPQERLAYFRDWARKRTQEERLNGVLILICRAPATLYVNVSQNARGIVTPAEEKTIHDALLKAFRDKKYDDGLAESVRLVRDAFAAQRP